ncbi:MAG: bifunctional UDP-2,4-diacetamido-2,4,6-trideoxy-beta-L-altropyranose hydrolase/GNAT family N-acetyltransferase [Candidatus Omnitrophica bacterium]|nr:bifunctional UDP-2,4-diacetamido-2,4,6-trideoxy-beta-L-altropyranose hydrolase/GNAT family N-acetyltransferase [Candidatus Omnitrophota bacterium]
MKVLFLTEGGRKIGFGHLTRCLALARALKRFDAKARVTFVVDGDRHAEKFLKANGQASRGFAWRDKIEKTLALVRANEFTVIDSYLAEKPLYEAVSDTACGCLLMIDDYSRVEYPRGIVVNPALAGDKFSYSRKDGTDYLLGKKYTIVRNEFLKLPRKVIKKEAKDILVTFGGKDYGTLLRKLTIFFLSRYSFKIHIVISDRKRVRPSLIGGNRQRVRIYSGISAEKMRSLMLRCDIAVSGGGQTLYELARCGIPAIGICLSENQVENLRAFQKSRFLEYTGWYYSGSLLKNLAGAVQRLLPYEARTRKSAIGKKLIDGKGTERIVKYMIEKRKPQKTSGKVLLRKAAVNDCRDLWLWRNNPTVRRWCFQTGEIAYAGHKKWFLQKLNGNKAWIYIAEDGNGNKIGQARFEKNGNAVFINVNLNPVFIGKGLGAGIIREATKRFFREGTSVDRVVAEIVGGNAASKRAFQKAGYIFSRKIADGNKAITVFTAKRQRGVELNKGKCLTV